jgi:hypothetical protein
MTFTEALGIEKYPQFFSNCYSRIPLVKEHITSGFYNFAEPNQPLTWAIRRCIVRGAVQEIAKYDAELKFKLSTVEPDFTREEPWAIKGASERDLASIATYLVSGLSAKKAAEEIASTSIITPWR